MIVYENITSIGLPNIPNGVHNVLINSNGANSMSHNSDKWLVNDRRDGTGLVITPGFVDMHSHSDLYRFVSTNHGTPLGDVPKIMQGCTFQVLGQDGYSAAPIRQDDKSDYSQFISGLDGNLPTEMWTWNSFGDYLSANSGIEGTKTAHLVGHSTLRRYVAGMAKRLLTNNELIQMCHLLDQCLNQGAIGLSTGLVYAPASFSNEAELTALAQVLAKHDSVMFVHLRSESTHIIEAAAEVANACVSTGCRLHISHIKTAGADNWILTQPLIRMLENYVNDHSLRLSADLHPYTAGSTMATVFLPGWFQTDDIHTTVSMLRNPELIERARKQILEDLHTWDNWWRFSGGWKGIRFSDCYDKHLIGKPLDQVLTGELGFELESYESFEWFFGILADSALQASIISFNNTEENILPFLKLPYVSLCTDGLINPTGRPHPRTYGAFPRLFRRFVRELGAIDLETAVDVACLRGRQVIGGSQINDHVVFDPELIEDMSTYENPVQDSTGIMAVLIKGVDIYGNNL